MEHLKPVLDRLFLSDENLERVLPSTAVMYDDEKDMSSEVTLSASGGVISKKKERSIDKTIYEFFSLEVWHNLLKLYSSVNSIKFNAPKPLGISSSNGGDVLHMSFVPGTKIKALLAFKKNTPVEVQGMEKSLSLYEACALHLGALNRIKEEEELKHGDFDGRHVLFSPLENVSMGVIDVENSLIEPCKYVLGKEAGKIAGEFMMYVPGGDKESTYTDSIRESYNRGREMIILPKGKPQLINIIAGLNDKFDVKYDMLNKKINGVGVHYNSKSKK